MTRQFLPHLFTLTLATASFASAVLAEQSLDAKTKIEAGKAFFTSDCKRCHSVDSDKQTYGPPLENVIGRPVGSVEGYAYSDALKSAGFVWTEGALRAWMEDNQSFVPGTKMRHVGITDPVVQAFIVAYLKEAATAAK